MCRANQVLSAFAPTLPRNTMTRIELLTRSSGGAGSQRTSSRSTSPRELGAEASLAAIIVQSSLLSSRARVLPQPPLFAFRFPRRCPLVQVKLVQVKRVVTAAFELCNRCQIYGTHRCRL